MDSTEPSPNNISASNLYRLSSMLDDPRYARLARETVQAFEAEVEQFPWCFAGLLGGVVWDRCGGKAIMIVHNDDDDDNGGHANANANANARGTVAEAVRRLRLKVGGVGRTVVAVGKGKGAWLRERNGLVRNLDLSKDGIWICEAGTCKQANLEEDF